MSPTGSLFLAYLDVAWNCALKDPARPTKESLHKCRNDLTALYHNAKIRALRK